MRDWLRYERRVAARAWQEVRAEMRWTVASIVRTAVEIGLLFLLLWLALDDTSFREEVGLIGLGAVAAVGTPALLLIFQIMRAPFLLSRDDLSSYGQETASLRADIINLNEQLQIYTSRPEDMAKIPIEDAIKHLPKERALQLFQEGAYAQRFTVFGREMPAKFKAGKTIMRFDASGRQEKVIGWPYFENSVLVLDAPRNSEVPEDGPFKPYTGKDDAMGQTLYTDLKVGKDQFEAFLRSIA